MKRQLLALVILALAGFGVAALMGASSVTAGYTTTGTTTTTNPCDSPAADQYDECYPTTTTTTTTTTTDETTTTPEQPRCEPGYGPYGGKDGDETDPYHNQECCPDANNDQRCDEAPPLRIETEPQQPPTTTTPTTPTTPGPPPATEPPVTQEPEPEPETTVSENPPTVDETTATEPEAEPTGNGRETLPHTGLSLLAGLAAGGLLAGLGVALRRRGQ